MNDFNKRELTRLHLALRLAILMEESNIDSLACSLKLRKGVPIDFIPTEWKNDADRLKRNIKAFEKLIKKIESML